MSSSAPGLVIQGAKERLAPILMTALATGLALVPLVVAGSIPGHEIEHPMAIVILGGLRHRDLDQLVRAAVALSRLWQESSAIVRLSQIEGQVATRITSVRRGLSGRARQTLRWGSAARCSPSGTRVSSILGLLRPPGHLSTTCSARSGLSLQLAACSPTPLRSRSVVRVAARAAHESSWRTGKRTAEDGGRATCAASGSR